MRILASLIFFLILVQFAHSQDNGANVQLNDSLIKADDKLSRFSNSIKIDWRFEVKQDKIIVTAKDSVYVLFYNAANRAVNDTSERLYDDPLYLKTNGKKILPALIFHIENKWTKTKKIEANTFNNKLYSEIKKLKDKYQLTKLQEWHKWGESGFVNPTEEEQKRINDYDTEKRKLEASRIRIPLHNSSHYSIFIEEKNWEYGLPHMISKVYPHDAINAIDQRIEDLLESHGDD